MKHNFFKTTLSIVFIGICAISCTEADVTLSEEKVNNEKIVYHYSGKTYTEVTLKNTFGPEVFYSTDWVMKGQKDAFLFDTEKEANTYLEKNRTTSQRFSRTPDYVFYEEFKTKGRSFQYFNASASKYTFPRFWRNRARSVRAELDAAEVVLFDNVKQEGASKSFSVAVKGKGTNFDGFAARADSFVILK